MAKEKGPAKASFVDQVNDYWGRRSANGTEGLALVGKLMLRFADYGDWDALARFVVKAGQHGQREKVVKITRAGFGNHVTFKTNAKHPAGGEFIKVNWTGEKFPIRQSNTFGIVKAAIDKGLSWDDRDFQRELPSADKKARQVSDEATKKVVKHLETYCGKLAADGFNVGEVLAALQKELAAKVKAATPVQKAAPVQKSMVNGVTVYEPSF